MTTHYAEKCPELKFVQADVRNYPKKVEDESKKDTEDPRAQHFYDETYDAVIDKACFDAVLCGDYSGPNSNNYLSEVDRVLKHDGIYVSITYGVPDSRLRHFSPKGNQEQYAWGSDVKIMRIAKTTYKKSEVVDAGKSVTKDDGKNFHYVYVMKKKGVPKASQVEAAADDQ